ncbi:cellulase family glycosylhydrolase [Paludicola sp. MB14-C6]|uniref:glycoside hydrolase family 5 protein n=1 Tax=Paludihabitans sp. MB14-C6 TaxID=3070656 RepID=UPI0027DD09BB|nr:cellulase family glycosylhydrolase [Paludicola sp. MB14-C6]WMJ23865.1 cellulase family glycosylhydrolase [Paludicola sp. MB14-C6]
MKVKIVLCILLISIALSFIGCNFKKNINSKENSYSSNSITKTENSSFSNELQSKTPINPQNYQALLGKGMDVDWSKTQQGRENYSKKAVEDFAKAGVKHVRIRIADDADDRLFETLDRQIKDCLDNNIIPIVAYQADELKNDPSKGNIDKVILWWGTVAKHYQNISSYVSFDLMIEVTDALNKQPQALNNIYEQLVAEIRKTNPTRIIMISPRMRSDPAYLNELKIPTKHNNYLMAEWHFYASGPSKENEKKLWTTGTPSEKQLILNKIQLALEWQKKAGISTWVGAWMPGDYNEGNTYSIQEQVAFAYFVTKALTNAKIPFAVNSDTKFYDREQNIWIKTMKPVFDAIY